MRFVAVTACPTGIAHTLMAAEALKRQAQVMGHELHVETQGAEGAKDPLSPETIARADAVIIAADIHVDAVRFAGKPVTASSTADAIRHPSDVLEAAAAATREPDVALPVQAPAPTVGVGVGATRVVAITSCPTGIAHTFMAAEGLRKAALAAGYWIKVETQGSVGAKDVLTDAEIAAADVVVIAADTKVDLARFVGKKVHQTGTKDALKHGPQVLETALAGAPVLQAGTAGGGGDGAATGAGAAGGSPSGTKLLTVLYQHLMTGISHMLPLITAGGLLIAISFAIDIDAPKAAMADTLAGRLFQVGGGAFTLFLPVLAGYIAYSIADRPGLAPGLVGGFLANEIQTGFLGAILAGFLAGYTTRWLAQNIKLPDALAGLKPVLILPLLATLVVGLAMFYVIGEPISALQDELTSALQKMQGKNAAILGAVLGAMMAFDMGGPLNKVAYAFAVGLIDTGIREPMAAVMAAGMTPPLGLALATVLFRNRWLPEEREAGKPAWALGLAFITEGAIPFAARNPARIIPALIAGSATAGAISLGGGAASIVPHGGIINIFIPNAITHGGVWLLAIAAGMVVTTAVLAVTTRAPAKERTATAPVPAPAPA
ncbi:MAG: fructose transporter subunit [Solirubrobacterales bacterium]|nr:fructose transporter subunit [Solirubrobacterales bacterium]